MGAWEAEEYEGVLLSDTAARWTADEFCSSKYSAVVEGHRNGFKQNCQYKGEFSPALDHTMFIKAIYVSQHVLPCHKNPYTLYVVTVLHPPLSKSNFGIINKVT